MISASAALTGSYDYSEVARSVLIAIFASYAALDLCGTRNRRTRPSSPGMVERWRHCDGHRYLGDAL